ncbi:Morn repeat protein [Pandoravirus inopinatum]|uniref:Morn repeat protein n=1 Tax=Pandoravirus inopinatum TaxID=1605721 RepID=A0A0B5JE23_9VIRU|nr:Morn repeat protein [Pandoravirus inopinatum]AJF98012.1 Morn repeat protein [Pandoravirus inopinatum]
MSLELTGLDRTNPKGCDKKDEDDDDEKGRPAADRIAPPLVADAHRNNGADDCLLLALPDELLLAILGVLSDAEVPARAAPVTRRLEVLSRDDLLWQSLYMHRYGPPMHEHLVEFGKDWRWLYRARSRRAGGGSVGPGCLAMADRGSFYCGDLDNGKPHGYGLRVYAKCLIGVRGIDPRDAFALPKDAVESRTEGQWARGKKHGRVIDSALGDRHDGLYAKGRRQGPGTHIWPSGSTYRGAYARGERSGWGVMDHADGRRYEGHWAHGQRNGEGTMTLRNGRSHRSHWVNGKPHGWGVHTWPNGHRVEATWDYGTPRGEGALVTADGRVFFDDAQELFCVGGAMIPAGILSDSADDWGGRLKRTRTAPREDAAHRRTVDTLYVDGSRLFVFWLVDGRSCRVVGHSSACITTAGCSTTMVDDGAAVGTCMACLLAAYMREPCQAHWYLPV